MGLTDKYGNHIMSTMENLFIETNTLMENVKIL